MITHLPELKSDLKIPIPKPKYSNNRLGNQKALRSELMCCKCKHVFPREDIIFRKNMKYCENCFPSVLENIWKYNDPTKLLPCVKCKEKHPKNTMVEIRLGVYRCINCL